MFLPKLRTGIYFPQNENIFTVFSDCKNNSVTYNIPDDTYTI